MSRASQHKHKSSQHKHKSAYIPSDQRNHKNRFTVCKEWLYCDIEINSTSSLTVAAWYMLLCGHLCATETQWHCYLLEQAR
jgi:hypothetical protein